MVVSLGGFICFGALFLFGYRAGRVIEELKTVMEALARGNMTRQMSPKAADGLGGLGRNLNLAVSNLKRTLSGFSHNSVTLARSAQVLDSNSKSLNEGAGQIVNQLNSSAAASEELSATAAEVAKNCSIASENSRQANEVAVTGQKVVNQAIAAMERTAEIVKDSAVVVKRLGARSDEIGKIIELIRSVASQTNLLALNAAIEAARAGEHGRGFAVVSDEVRQLAAKTADATEQIGATVETMQKDLALAVGSMEEGVNVVQAGTRETEKSGAALSDILARIETVASEIEHIANASREQTTTTESLSNSLHEVAKVMDETARNVNDNTRVVAHLTSSAKEMKHLIGQFRLVTLDDAESMVNRAYDHVQKFGREKAFADFNDPEGGFTDGELFILVQNYDGIMLAYGGEAALVGKNLKDARDANGERLAPALIRIAKTKGSGWHRYHFMNPQTDKVEPKQTYLRALGNDCYIACGIYQSE
ncbi:MAG: methyl-accepting chemotaxis protein [Exilibacterium sp.]